MNSIGEKFDNLNSRFAQLWDGDKISHTSNTEDHTSSVKPLQRSKVKVGVLRPVQQPGEATSNTHVRVVGTEFNTVSRLASSRINYWGHIALGSENFLV